MRDDFDLLMVICTYVSRKQRSSHGKQVRQLINLGEWGLYNTRPRLEMRSMYAVVIYT